MILLAEGCQTGRSQAEPRPSITRCGRWRFLAPPPGAQGLGHESPVPVGSAGPAPAGWETEISPRAGRGQQQGYEHAWISSSWQSSLREASARLGTSTMVSSFPQRTALVAASGTGYACQHQPGSPACELGTFQRRSHAVPPEPSRPAFLPPPDPEHPWQPPQKATDLAVPRTVTDL